MGVYVITDGNGSFIRHDEGTGRYVPIRSFKHAKQWDSAAKANAILKNSISSSIKSNYEVRLVETGQTVEYLLIHWFLRKYSEQTKKPKEFLAL